MAPAAVPKPPLLVGASFLIPIDTFALLLAVSMMLPLLTVLPVLLFRDGQIHPLDVPYFTLSKSHIGRLDDIGWRRLGTRVTLRTKRIGVWYVGATKFGGEAPSWSSKTKDWVMLSSAEAEYVALAAMQRTISIWRCFSDLCVLSGLR